MSAVHAVALALLTVAVTACDQPPTAVVEVPPANLDFLNGPDDLPNVFRTATNAGFAMRDPSTGYIVMAGLPTPPSSITLCGGTMPFQTDGQRSLHEPHADEQLRAAHPGRGSGCGRPVVSGQCGAA